MIEAAKLQYKRKTTPFTSSTVAYVKRFGVGFIQTLHEVQCGEKQEFGDFKIHCMFRYFKCSGF